MATLVRWSPLQELESLERRMRRLLDEVGLFPATVPAADVYEADGEYVVELEAPGFDESELSVEVTDHTLVVRGERSEEKAKKERNYRLHERIERAFERRFELPPEADPDRIAAEFANGVLTVHAPKSAAAKVRKVEIATKP